MRWWPSASESRSARGLSSGRSAGRIPAEKLFVSVPRAESATASLALDSLNLSRRFKSPTQSKRALKWNLRPSCKYGSMLLPTETQQTGSSAAGHGWSETLYANSMHWCCSTRAGKCRQYKQTAQPPLQHPDLFRFRSPFTHARFGGSSKVPGGFQPMSQVQ